MADGSARPVALFSGSTGRAVISVAAGGNWPPFCPEVEMNGRERILRFLRGDPVDHLPLMPITMMFAADQIGAPYRKYVTDHRVLAEAQMVTAERFGIDYVSAISDPAREACDCGAEVTFFEDQPPAIDEANALLKDKGRLASLQAPDPRQSERMCDRLRAVALLKREAGDQRLVEGWIEGPCAEAADLRGINNLMLDFYDDPPFARELLDFVTTMEVEFARAQMDSGADVIGIGDAASSLVGPEIYDEFIWALQKRMVDALHAMGAIVRLHICGDTRPLLPGLGRLGCEIVDLDYPSPMETGRRAMGEGQVLLGNINPVRVLLQGTPESVREALEVCWRQAGPRYIVGAGCEVARGTPEENLRAMTEFALSHS
jgi:MtaA/CmuA family methyltransferase